MATNQQADAFVTLAVAQGLIRNGFVIETEMRLPSGFRPDLFAYTAKLNFIIEIKIAEDENAVPKIMTVASKQLAKEKDYKSFIVIGIRNSAYIFLPDELRKKMSFTRSDFIAKRLPSVVQPN
jgi:hypothetical protein